MPQTRTAVIVGALGVIGRYLVEKFAGLPDWQVVGLSRRKGEDRDRVRYLSIDLGNAEEASSKLHGLSEATHVFYCAFQATGTQAADYARGTAVNLALLENSVRAIDAVAANLQRVVLITGTKYYGSHLGPFKTPAREDDPRHMPPD
ncbi:MAG: NAD-dependent epimerase/dehydratase family protein, partial [Betaproteobacteria bacterium]|nr:NAD-dependent epimerase/dehydratase family protein [Betaproteobacteria bacterium]